VAGTTLTEGAAGAAERAEHAGRMPTRAHWPAARPPPRSGWPARARSATASTSTRRRARQRTSSDRPRPGADAPSGRRRRRLGRGRSVARGGGRHGDLTASRQFRYCTSVDDYTEQLPRPSAANRTAAMPPAPPCPAQGTCDEHPRLPRAADRPASTPNLQQELQGIRDAGLYKTERILVTPQARWSRPPTPRGDHLCANNYLRAVVATPAVIEPATRRWRTAGRAPVRFICGTQDLQRRWKRAWRASSALRRDPLRGGFDANGGLSSRCWRGRRGHSATS